MANLHNHNPSVSWLMFSVIYLFCSLLVAQRLFYQETLSSSPFQRAPGAEFKSQSLEEREEGQVGV